VLLVNSASMKDAVVNLGFNDIKRSKEGLTLVFYSIPLPPYASVLMLSQFPELPLFNTFLCTKDLLPDFDTLHFPSTLSDLKHSLTISVSSHSTQHLPSTSILATLHLHSPPACFEREENPRGVLVTTTPSLDVTSSPPRNELSLLILRALNTLSKGRRRLLSWLLSSSITLVW